MPNQEQFFDASTHPHCPSPTALLALLAGTPFDAPQRALTLAHLDACSDCQAALGVLAGDGARAPTDTDRREVEIGSRIGRFELERVLGVGAMGVVYQARDPQLERQVALKVLRSQTSAEDHTIGRLQAEARAMARLRHPNAVAVYEVGVADGMGFLAMEYVEGASLGAVMAACRLSRARRWKILLASGRALAAAHRAGLVHRDFKPDNVLVGPGDVAKVGDFGLSSIREVAASWSHCSTLIRTGSVVGTPWYMAPEVMDGYTANAASDQYGFCVTMAEVLRGRPIFDASVGWHGLLAAKQGGEFDLSGLRVGDRAVVARGLHPNPHERYGSMDALLHALRRAESRRRWSPVGLAVGLSAAVGLLVPACVGLRTTSAQLSHALSNATAVEELSREPSTSTRTVPPMVVPEREESEPSAASPGVVGSAAPVELRRRRNRRRRRSKRSQARPTEVLPLGSVADKLEPITPVRTARRPGPTPDPEV